MSSPDFVSEFYASVTTAIATTKGTACIYYFKDTNNCIKPTIGSKLEGCKYSWSLKPSVNGTLNTEIVKRLCLPLHLYGRLYTKMYWDYVILDHLTSYS